MGNFEHKQILKQLISLNEIPNNQDDMVNWVRAENHLDFLKSSKNSNEVIIYGSSEYSFIHTIVVDEDQLEPLDKSDLLGWSCNPYCTVASYVSGGGREGYWIERERERTGSKILDTGTPLIFGRTFEGWSGSDKDYYELLQEYAHLEEIHWRPEHKSYCKYDESGDLEQVVSVTKRSSVEKASLVTFSRRSLEAYLAASNKIAVRLFDFTLYPRGSFNGWGQGPEDLFDLSDELFYRQKNIGVAAYTRGVQIIRPSRTKSQIFKDISARWFGKKDELFVKFIAQDWRNNKVCDISTDPACTTNYFEAKDNDLPFELSPAFFKPEVLLKYKADREKYTVGDRDIRCRSAWSLRGIDVNEAGQVHAYIGDLRKLPYTEQLHWSSYNEHPKTGISKRAIVNDFQGRFTDIPNPLGKILRIINCWNDDNVAFWRLRDDRTLEHVSVPYTSSRDEWGDSFLNLAKLLNEGFVVENIRQCLTAKNINFTKEDKSLVLLEKFISFGKSEAKRLEGLRTVQLIRTKVKGHNEGSDADLLAQQALTDHDNFANHFQHICGIVATELVLIEEQIKDSVK